jgi:DUF4097 and DUF4098 domain-containing protein YvlB
MVRKSLALAGAAAVLVAGVLSASPASAKARTVTSSGKCSVATATWKLKAKDNNGKIEVEYEVDVNKNGQVFAWTLKDNGVKVAGGNATTVAPSGSFTVKRIIANKAGADKITATAVRGAVTCSGGLTF